MQSKSAGKDIIKKKFTDSWVTGFLWRVGLKRRRVTSVAKEQDVPAVQTRMRAIQKTIVDCGFSPEQVFSSDETRIFFGIAPKIQYVPHDKRRAKASHGSDEKARFTAMLFASAAGTVGPPFFIVKCSIKGPDLSKSTVLTKLKEKPYFASWTQGGWWHTVIDDGRAITYRRPYLRDPVTLATVTVQHQRTQVGLTKDGDSFRNFTLRGSLGTGQHPFKEAATSDQVTLDEIAVPLELTQVEAKDSDGEDVSGGESVSESDV